MIIVFISQPMRGRTDEEIRKTRNEAIQKVKELHKNEDVHIIESYFGISGKNNNPLKSLAMSLELLADADEIYFVKDWETTRGCRLEHDVAVEYNIPIITEK